MQGQDGRRVVLYLNFVFLNVFLYRVFSITGRCSAVAVGNVENVNFSVDFAVRPGAHTLHFSSSNVRERSVLLLTNQTVRTVLTDQWNRVL
jgi:hypothetical protein